jgi:hypothetical protein
MTGSSRKRRPHCSESPRRLWASGRWTMPSSLAASAPPGGLADIPNERFSRVSLRTSPHGSAHCHAVFRPSLDALGIACRPFAVLVIGCVTRLKEGSVHSRLRLAPPKASPAIRLSAATLLISAATAPGLSCAETFEIPSDIISIEISSCSEAPSTTLQGVRGAGPVRPPSGGLMAGHSREAEPPGCR